MSKVYEHYIEEQIMFGDQYDEWDDVLIRIEKEHGVEAAEQVSQQIDDGVISILIDELKK